MKVAGSGGTSMSQAEVTVLININELQESDIGKHIPHSNPNRSTDNRSSWIPLVREGDVGGVWYGVG